MNKKTVSVTIKLSDEELCKINDFVNQHASQFDRSEFIRICTKLVIKLGENGKFVKILAELLED